MSDRERHRVTLTDIAFGGDCIARIDNQVVFVSGGLPGEEVVVELTQSKKDYRRGRVVEVISPSPARVEPRCPHFGRCGGCHWQYIDYPTQLEMKRKVVADQLRRIGGFSDAVSVNPTLGAPDPWHYRNNARFAVREGRLGFMEEGSHRFFPVDRCYLLHPAINDVLAALQGKVPSHVDHLTVRYGVKTGQLLVHPALHLPEVPVASGQKHLEEELLQRRFRISAESFFQVNTLQAERLIGYAIGQLKPHSTDTVLDVYCGVGTFGLLLAGKVARVIGVEESVVALRDARHNARDLKNMEFIQGPAEEVLARLREDIDKVIIDPPRAGCKRAVVDALKRLHPAVIVYVSCDPATLARDLKLLCADGGYAIEDVQPVDMFPQTYHIETVAALKRLYDRTDRSDPTDQSSLRPQAVLAKSQL